MGTTRLMVTMAAIGLVAGLALAQMSISALVPWRTEFQSREGVDPAGGEDMLSFVDASRDGYDPETVSAGQIVDIAGAWASAGVSGTADAAGAALEWIAGPSSDPEEVAAWERKLRHARIVDRLRPPEDGLVPRNEQGLADGARRLAPEPEYDIDVGAASALEPVARPLDDAAIAARDAGRTADAVAAALDPPSP